MFYSLLYIFFFNDTPTTEIYTLSLHDALPISKRSSSIGSPVGKRCSKSVRWPIGPGRKSGSTPALVAWLICRSTMRSEEHTSELQSHSDLVCRLLLEKKKK